MSKLQELIKELCPDGVEFKKLGEVCEIFSGKNKQKNDEGEYPVYGSTGIIAYCDNYKYSKEQLLIARVGANAGFTHIANGKYDVSDNTLIVDVVGGNCLKYIYYLLVNLNLNKYSKGGGQPLVTAGEIKFLEIPLPPLEVQNEIVRILDTFTSHAAELQAELQARKEQYEYYRNKLLTFDENDEGVKWMRMEETCKNICSGGTPSTSNKEFYRGNIPWLRTQEVDWKDVYDTEFKISEDAVRNSSAKLIPNNCVIVAMYGATAGKTCINRIPLTTNQACCNLEINKEIALYKYVYHWLCKEYYNLKALGEGSQSNISGKKIKSYKIPIPTLSEQQRIVSILDKFESLVNDLTAGLPAEIAAVQEQYEYYRNKLLSFKRI